MQRAIAPLFDLGVEIQENSELDLFMSFNAHENDPRIPEVVKDMEAELGDGNKMRKFCRNWRSMNSPCWIGWKTTAA